MKTRRRYALFEKQEGRWVRISSFSCFKESAVRIFQNALLEPFINGIDGERVKGERSLRPVQETYDFTQK